MRKTFLAIAAIAAAVACGPALARAEVKTVTEPLDMAMVKRNHNFGYTDAEIRQYFDYPQTYTFNTTGLDPNAIHAAPAAGTHPRVLFTPDDLPALRKKLNGDGPAGIQMRGIRAELKKDLTGPQATYAAIYDAAAEGKADPKLTEVAVACPIMYEAFRCLIDQDEAGGKKAAAALVTLAKADDVAFDAALAKYDAAGTNNVCRPPLRDFQAFRSYAYSGLLGLAYDCAYGFMDGAQRDAVRAVVAKTQADMSLLCAEALPAYPANASNWIPMHQCLLLECTAIDGEPGYDRGTYERCVASCKRFLNVNIFPAGDSFDAMGKDFLCAENLVAVAERGLNLLTLQQVRNQVNGFYLNAMDPWGGHFTFYDSLGGRGNNTPMSDVEVIKHVFPNDPTVDFVYRNNVGEDYAYYKGQVHFGHPMYLTTALIHAVFAEPYMSKTWAQAQADATKGQPLTFFSEGTGNLITRDAWTPDAVQFHFLTRSVSGGHQYADRSHFNLHALGRYWAIYEPLRQVPGADSPRNRSVVLIDGEGPGTTLGRVAELADTAASTFITADIKVPWEWASGGNERFPQGGQRVEFPPNKFRLEKSDLPWMNMAFSDLPNWATAQKGAENWIPRAPIVKAFRTAGLIRGKHPFVVIADDIQKDQASHAYEWGMSLEHDLVCESASAGGADTILASTDKADDRRLLVRTLSANGVSPDAPAALVPVELPNPPMKPVVINRLAVTANAVSPDFRMLLFPHHHGEALPRTTWNADHTTLDVDWGDQHDTLTFARTPEGFTRVSVASSNSH